MRGFFVSYPSCSISESSVPYEMQTQGDNPGTMCSAPLTVEVGPRRGGKMLCMGGGMMRRINPCQVSGFCIYTLSGFCNNEVDCEPAEDIEKAN